MRQIISLDHWQLWLLFFGLPLFQIATGYGLVIFGWTIGIFPSVILYFLWLYGILTRLANGNRYLTLRISLFVLALIVLPVYNLLINVIEKDSPSAFIITLYGGITFIAIVVLTILSWNAVSRLTWHYENKQKVHFDLIDFSSYKKYFWQFMGGPFTFIFLDRHIKNGIQSKVGKP